MRQFHGGMTLNTREVERITDVFGISLAALDDDWPIGSVVKRGRWRPTPDSAAETTLVYRIVRKVTMREVRAMYTKAFAENHSLEIARLPLRKGIWYEVMSD